VRGMAQTVVAGGSGEGRLITAAGERAPVLNTHAAVTARRISALVARSYTCTPERRSRSDRPRCHPC